MPDRAGERRREIGQNVGVQVGGDDGVEARRLQHHAGRHRVDQHLVARYVGIFGGDLTSHLVPEHHAEALGVGLRHHRQKLARPRARHVERKMHDPFDARTREDGNLGRNFNVRAAMRPPAVTRIFALRILTNDHPVDILRANVAERALNSVEDARRPNVGVLVEETDRWPAASPKA